MVHFVYWAFAFFFLVGSVVNLRPNEPIRTNYARWGYPTWFPSLTGCLELLTACLLVFPQTRFEGTVLGAAIMLAAAATVIWNKEYWHALPPVGVLAGLALVTGFAAMA
ncbi:DoxX family protein [Methyloligella sp. 2.7D]|uniref:DoxX family protein n=1 Tax=unclassified Methyloligella TaxID=2625955 RepID=UPI00157CC23C|nr:DoxX family protein [Methyloligella sp. GL2]QKP76353.1 DoxX family protein [Methyloligella sp. GL2]